jgi:hypothetical protein
MKTLVVTTFNEKGMHTYGQKFIDTFSKNVDPKIDLRVYAEQCTPNVNDPHDRIGVFAAETALDKLRAFKEKWKDIPKANGKCPFPERRPRDWHKEFKWDAIRFANKVYAVFDACEDPEYDLVVWMDGDTVCHSPITYEKFISFFPDNTWLSYLGRGKKWPECGFYGLQTKKESAKAFLKEFERVYEDADNGIFKMEEWHDSYVFDEVLKRIRSQYPEINDLSGHLVKGEGHPLINTELGAYFDHLKGARKNEGMSRKRDLFMVRQEDYWKEVK